MDQRSRQIRELYFGLLKEIGITHLEQLAKYDAPELISRTRSLRIQRADLPVFRPAIELFIVQQLIEGARALEGHEEEKRRFGFSGDEDWLPLLPWASLVGEEDWPPTS